MRFLKRIKRCNFYIRLRHWEYWPFGLVQFPLFFYYLWLAARARSLVFFSACNPGIAMGGMFGESKFDILEKIPSGFKPKTALIKRPATVGQVLTCMETHGLNFPVIFKPDIGERGYLVKKICTREEVAEYLRATRVDFIIQEFVSLPYEYGVFYRRYPGETHGKVTSVVAKEMLHVEGNGKSTLKELIFSKDRAKLQWTQLKELYQGRMDEVIPHGQRVELVGIGNHCRGTKFINANHLINDRLCAAFDCISRSVEGFYFGRFDLRCSCEEDLFEGKVSILELNGCGAEPGHIYDPQFRLLDAVRDLLRHWMDIFDIAMENHKRGERFLTLREGIRYYRKFRAALR